MERAGRGGDGVRDRTGLPANPEEIDASPASDRDRRCGSFVLRLITTPIAAIVFLTKSMSMTPADLARTNSWALYSPSELIQNMSMAIVMGLVLGFIEYFGREAWLRLEVGRNEGRDYTLDRQVTRIGSAEGADISLREDPAVLPFHAQIAEQLGTYFLSSLGGPLAVNGFPVQSAALQAGDMIHLGRSALRFSQKGARRSAPRPSPRAYRFLSRLAPSLPQPSHKHRLRPPCSSGRAV